jgi:hypothetical protein
MPMTVMASVAIDGARASRTLNQGVFIAAGGTLHGVIATRKFWKSAP